MRRPAQIGDPQFELRLLGDDDFGGGGDHRRCSRWAAGDRLRIQLDRPLCLWCGDAGALHPAHPGRRSENAARRRRAEPRAGKDPRGDDAAGEIRRSQRALDRHRHDRGRGLGCGGEDRGEAAASPAGRALQRRQGRHRGVLLRRRRVVFPGTDDQGSAGRDAPTSRCRLHDGEDEGRRPPARRGRAAGGSGEGDPPRAGRARGRCQFQVRPRGGARLCARARAVWVALVRGALRSARFRAAGGDRREL